MLWSLRINEKPVATIEYESRPLPGDFGIVIKTAVQYEVVPVSAAVTEFDAKLGRQSDAVFSPCRKWRYALFRNWVQRSVFATHRDPRYMALIGLNPSTATETTDDPTIRRVIGFAKTFGFDGLVMLNAFAFRATDPADMKAQDDPVGPDNNAVILHAVRHCRVTVAAWGVHGAFRGRQSEVLRMLRGNPIHHFGLTKGGFPKHPLYLPASKELELWTPNTMRDL